ncbi:MAG: 50S ribosomal protein L3 [Candidatus Hodarchaeales archaeon]
MGRRRYSAPKRGSMAFTPRKKVRRESHRWRKWTDWNFDEPRLTGYAGYKAGMTHVVMIQGKRKGLHYKQELVVPVTVIEVPNIIVFGIRTYTRNIDGLKVVGELLADKFNKSLRRKLKLPESIDKEEYSAKLDDFKQKMEGIDIAETRVFAHTNPAEAGLSKKTPDILEILVSGNDPGKNLEYALDLQGKEISFKDHFKIGDYIDVAATTKGKGFQGVVKRHNVAILHRKKRKSRRVVGCIGPWTPSRVSWRVPRAGQMGYHGRTEYNKQVLKISDNGREITPDSGFKHYGVVRSSYVLIKGSVPGPVKRLVRMRQTMRQIPVELIPDDRRKEDDVKISYVSTAFSRKEGIESGTS